MDADVVSLTGGRPLPVLQGSLLDFPDDPIACMRRQLRQLGHVSALEQDGQRIHFAFGPHYNHQVLSNSAVFHSRFFAVRGPRKSPQRRLSSGLLSQNGDEHKRNRRLMMEALSKKAIQGYTDTIRILAEEMINGWQPGQEFDLNREMTEFMLRLTSTILFGLDDSELAYTIGRKIDHWVHLNHEMGMGAFVSDPDISSRYPELLEFSRGLEAEIAGLIQLRRDGSQNETNLLSLLLHAHDEQGAISDETLIGQTALLFAAAHLTTAHSLTWTLFLLAQHPSAMGELHAELTRELNGQFPSPEDVERLSCMERCIKESMRVLPASSYSQRITAQPTELGPFSLSAGQGIVFSQFITHHLPELYPEPDAFLPRRWETISPSPYAYLPFGSGPRMCIGAPLAMLILKMVIPAILQRFQVNVVPGIDVSGKVISTMLSPTSRIMVHLSEPTGKFSAQPVGGNIHDLVELREIPKRNRVVA